MYIIFIVNPVSAVSYSDTLCVTEAMLRLYCEKVGIEFEDSMINWDEQPKDMAVSTRTA